MPHCIIEYSQNLAQEISPEDWLEAVFDACVESKLFDIRDIKVRAAPFKYFVSGGDEDAFVHVDVKILSGRTSEQKDQLADLVIAKLTSFGSELVSYSVDIIDMERQHYRKQVLTSDASK
jgi:5-carboxymethyl-2-hydroxymuconate isomerase